MEAQHRNLNSHFEVFGAHSGVVEAHPGDMHAFTVGIEQWRKGSYIKSSV
jgi:hypothetical protein